MSTRSAIGMLKDGKIKTIYCHWDGYINGGVGEILVKFYKTPEVIEKLLALGDISALGETPNVGESFTTLDPEVTRPYSLRGEVCPATEYKSLTELADYYDDVDYIYIFKDNEWFYFTHRDIEDAEFDNKEDPELHLVKTHLGGK